jgi:hypothetical protein
MCLLLRSHIQTLGYPTLTLPSSLRDFAGEPALDLRRIFTCMEDALTRNVSRKKTNRQVGLAPYMLTSGSWKLLSQGL